MWPWCLKCNGSLSMHAYLVWLELFCSFTVAYQSDCSGPLCNPWLPAFRLGDDIQGGDQPWWRSYRHRPSRAGRYKITAKRGGHSPRMLLLDEFPATENSTKGLLKTDYLFWHTVFHVANQPGWKRLHGNRISCRLTWGPATVEQPAQTLCSLPLLSCSQWTFAQSSERFVQWKIEPCKI